MRFEVRRQVTESCIVDAADQAEADLLGVALAAERVMPNEEGFWTFDGSEFLGASPVPELESQG